MRLSILAIKLVLISCFSFSQEGVTVHHYERKKAFEHLMMPYDNYNSSIYAIHIPDSIYDDAHITIKKGSIGSVKVGLNNIVENKIYQSVKIKVKGKKNINRLTNLIVNKIEEKELNEGINYTTYKGNKLKIIYTQLSWRKAIIELSRHENS